MKTIIELDIDVVNLHIERRVLPQDMVPQGMDVKLVSSMVCMVTLAGYAWVKGWGWLSEKSEKDEEESRAEKRDTDGQNANNADIADSASLALLNDRLWELTVDIDRLRGQVSDMTENECTDSELNAAFENHRIENQQQRFREQDEGFNGSAQTEYATEEDIYDLPDLERRSYTRSITTSPVSQTAHILGSVQTREIRGTWVVILAQLQKVGVQCIVDLFELHPFVREHFKEILIQYGKTDPENDNVLQNILENHAKLVMNIVHELVVNIDNLDSLTPKLQKLGLFHVKNAVPRRYLDIMGPIFCNAVRPILLRNNIWTSEVEESWMELFKILTNIL